MGTALSAVDTIKVTLSPAQDTLAKQRMAWKDQRAQELGLHHKGGSGGFSGDVDTKQLMGFRAECAVACTLGLPWPLPDGPQTMKDKPDVGPFEVRATRPPWDLVVRPTDKRQDPYLLCWVEDTTVELVGWCWPHEAKQKHFIKDPNGRGWAYFVPASHLRSIFTWQEARHAKDQSPEAKAQAQTMRV